MTSIERQIPAQLRNVLLPQTAPARDYAVRQLINLEFKDDPSLVNIFCPICAERNQVVSIKPSWEMPEPFKIVRLLREHFFFHDDPEPRHPHSFWWGNCEHCRTYFWCAIKPLLDRARQRRFVPKEGFISGALLGLSAIRYMPKPWAVNDGIANCMAKLAANYEQQVHADFQKWSERKRI